ncbi:monocarboxylate transporter, putative [Plasmodium gallinaceum]|uniref:Monocarboxylate transporter, putative n=1 Tax=Plasmodium gallinaceum TaxID=5849 RepID=A0A1J1GW82_PLAGA|nr:monocarboxylate transporter, putative [Plasmodium gallinaceum]CRG96811.1 monocarboxylate transporter, putative [Plasmodium gallinaceum]
MNFIPKAAIPYVVLFGAFLYNLNIGIVNSYGNLNIYLTSYLRYKNSNVTYRDVSFIYELSIITLGVSMLIGNIVHKILGLRTTILLCSVSTFFAFYLSSIYTHSYFLLCLFMGILYGLGYGICFTIPLSCAYKHFKNNRGLISGIVISAISLCPFLYCPLQTLLINRKNVLPTMEEGSDSKELYFHDEDVLNRVPYVLFIQSIMLLSLCSLGGFLATIENKENNENSEKVLQDKQTKGLDNNITDLEKNNEALLSVENEKDDEKNLNNEKKENNAHDNVDYCNSGDYSTNVDSRLTESFIKKNNTGNELDIKEKQSSDGNKNDSLCLNEVGKEKLSKNKTVNKFYNKKCIEDKSFIILWISVVLFNSYVNYIIMYWKIIGINYTSVEDKIITLNGSFANSLSNIAGRLVWGYLYDKFSLSFILLLLGSCICSSCFILPFICHIYVLYLLFCAILYFCVGGSLVTIPVITLKKYGEQYFSLNMSVLYTSRIANTFLCSLLVGIFYNLLTLKYLSVSFGLISFLSTISIFFLTK